MRRILLYRLRRTTLLLLLFISVLGGLALARVSYHAVSGLACCLTLIPAAVVWRKHNLVTLIAVLVVGVCFGLWRGEMYIQKLSAYSALKYQKITITAHAMNDALYGYNKQLTFDANGLRLAEGTHLAGKMQVSGFGANAIFQGDEVQITGKLYPGRGAYQGRISYGQVTVLKHHPSLASVVRQKFTAGMQTALPEPLAPFAMGLLVGQRANLPDTTKQDLLMVGLTHIIAVSGYNLTIILHAARRLFAGQSKRIVTGLSFLLIGAFLLLTGASASIVRAAIVSTLSTLAAYYGREFKPLNLIFLTAAITAWANPVYLWSDLSWYLSFLAFYGVMVISPLVQKRWPGHWHQSFFGSVALESVCAELMSVPFILYIFGQMSLIGLPANVLVVTLVPLAMLLSLIAGLAGMFAGSSTGWFAWPAVILLNYMLDVAHILAGLPHVFVQHRQLPLSGMLGLYVIVIGISIVLWHKTKQPKNATITDKKSAILEGVTA